MIICQIITTLVYGGAERLLVNFANVLGDKHELHVIYLKGEPKLKSAFSSKIKIHYVPLGMRCASEIRSLLKELKPDIVHTHLGHADLIGLWSCRNLPVKRFCTMHNVYFKWNWLDKIFFVLYYATFKMHGKTCTVSCISRAVAKHVRETLGVSQQKISINYNAIPDLDSKVTKAQARNDLNLKDSDFCVLTIGRLRVQKSTETLLYAASALKTKIRNLKVLIVGEGELENNLRLLSEKLMINDVVVFCGVTKTPEKYFASSDVFVLPSVFEGLPTVVLEAFRSSVPVIASNIDGTNELIENEKNGLLFEAKDHQQLGDQLLRLYNSPSLRQQLGQEGYQSFNYNYRIESYADQMESLYRK